MKKWKYLKGSESDFMGAPDWAIIYAKVMTCGKLVYAYEGPEGEYAHHDDLEVIYNDGTFTQWSWVNKPEIIAQRQLISDDEQDLNECIGVPESAAKFTEVRCDGKTYIVQLGDGDIPMMALKNRARGGLVPNNVKIGTTSEGSEVFVNIKVGELYTDGKVHAATLGDGNIPALIAERGKRYGKFKDGAEIMRDLKHVMHEVDGWNNLSPSQKEALDMIQHKIGRILNGDPNYDDNWKDVAGYATLIVNELNGEVK